MNLLIMLSDAQSTEIVSTCSGPSWSLVYLRLRLRCELAWGGPARRLLVHPSACGLSRQAGAS